MPLSADLIVLSIYRKYYGFNVAAFLFGAFYVAMAEHRARVVAAYTTWLNIVFLGSGAFTRSWGTIKQIAELDSSQGRLRHAKLPSCPQMRKRGFGA